MKRYRLMIPGPIEVEHDVLMEMSGPMRAHYGREWVEVYNETRSMLKRVFQTEGDVYLLVGSGSAGLDAAIGSLVGGDGKALVVSNGFFGERLQAITKSYTDNVKVVKGELHRAISPEMLEDALLAERDVEAVAAVHCETSTGVLNPIEGYGAICKRHGAILVVDAISSLGGVELKSDDWNVGICVGATQKCLEAPPGLCPMAISNKAWERIEAHESPGWYLNLRTWKKYAERWADWHPYPITMAVNSVMALRKSLEKILAEGLEERFRRHDRMASIVRCGLKNLDFELFVPDDCCSNTVTTAWSDPRISAPDLIRFLREERGIMIAGGLEELRGKIFRIGHMGPQATLESIRPLLFGIEEALRSAGVDIEVGQSLHGLDVSTREVKT